MTKEANSNNKVEASDDKPRKRGRLYKCPHCKYTNKKVQGASLHIRRVHGNLQILPQQGLTKPPRIRGATTYKGTEKGGKGTLLLDAMKAIIEGNITLSKENKILRGKISYLEITIRRIVKRLTSTGESATTLTKRYL